MGRGRKIVPIPIKKAKGTYRSDRDRNAPDPNDKKPIAPRRLNKRAKQIFWHMTNRLNDLGLASRSWTEYIAELSMWMEEEERFGKILNEGDQMRHFYKTKNTSGEIVYKEHPIVKLRDRASKNVQRILSVLGLSPTDVQKVGKIKGPKKDDNEFSDF